MSADWRLEDETPAPSLTPALRALWWDAKGDWERAHDEIAHQSGRDAAWAHAYLHRKEGDRGNARYWYMRAGQPECTSSLAEEWKSITDALRAGTSP